MFGVMLPDKEAECCPYFNLHANHLTTKVSRAPFDFTLHQCCVLQLALYIFMLHDCNLNSSCVSSNIYIIYMILLQYE